MIMDYKIMLEISKLCKNCKSKKIYRKAMSII